MKAKVMFVLLLTLALVLVSANVFAQQAKGGGWAAGSAYNRLFNPATVETLSGEVTKVEKITTKRGMSYGVHVQLKTGNETIAVHLGPAWFIDSRKIKIDEGDKIEVTGSRITFNNAPAIIASEIKKGDNVLKLRNTNGFPAWAGRGGR